MRGIRQGCPIFPYLFLLAAQILCVHVNLKGITIAEREVVICQLADEATLCLSNDRQILLAINIMDSFSKALGLYLNIQMFDFFFFYKRM